MKTTTTWMAAMLAAVMIADLAPAQRRDGSCRQEPQAGCRLEEGVGLGKGDVALLQRTMADELFARDYYLAAAERFGTRRFANLARAEQHHIDALDRILSAAGADPVSVSGREVELPATMIATEATAAEHERHMIAAYDELLAKIDVAAVRPTLEHIQVANRRHLAATGGEDRPGRGQGARGPRGNRGQGAQSGRAQSASGRSGGRGVEWPARCGSRCCRF